MHKFIADCCTKIVLQRCDVGYEVKKESAVTFENYFIDTDGNLNDMLFMKCLKAVQRVSAEELQYIRDFVISEKRRMRENMLEIEEIVQNQSEQQIKMDPEIQKMQNMTEKEALKYLGLERTPVYGDLDQILSKKNSWARMIVNYLMENYPELMPLMVCNGKLEILLVKG